MIPRQVRSVFEILVQWMVRVERFGLTRKPPIDLYDEWLAFERMIFPSPVWDGYR